MKTIQSLIVKFFMLSLLLGVGLLTSGQSRPSVGIISIDTHGLDIGNTSMASLVRLELEKTNKFEVLDRYDINDALASNNIEAESCFGKSNLIKVGRIIGAEKMLTGSVERFGGKILLTLHLIDTKTEKIERAAVKEFVNQEEDIQIMARLVLNELLGIPNDERMLELLANFDAPIVNSKTILNLSGPRMGMAFTTGETGQRLMDSKESGGYDMFPITSVFGYQWEKQYLSSGDFQALIEVFGMVSGLESGTIIPSLVFMNGFRFNNSGFEFGLGPVIRVVRATDGYWKDDEWVKASTAPSGYDLTKAIDRRGELAWSPGLIVAVGKTFRSGYLNIPVNLYYSPRKTGSVIGLTFGFNIAKPPR